MSRGKGGNGRNRRGNGKLAGNGPHFACIDQWSFLPRHRIGSRKNLIIASYRQETLQPRWIIKIIESIVARTSKGDAKVSYIAVTFPRLPDVCAISDQFIIVGDRGDDMERLVETTLVWRSADNI